MSETDRPVERRDYRVGGVDARRMSVAFAFYRSTRPAFLGALVLVAAGGILFAAGGDSGPAVFAGVFVVALIVLNVVNVPVMTRALQARGYRPGSVIRVEWYADRFTITTERASATHLFDEVRRTKRIGRVIAIRTTASRLLLLLPDQLVPREMFDALRLS